MKKARKAQDGLATKKIAPRSIGNPKMVPLEEEVMEYYDPYEGTVIRRWADGTTSQMLTSEGGNVFIGRQGEVGITNVPDPRYNAIADSLTKADWSLKVVRPLPNKVKKKVNKHQDGLKFGYYKGTQEVIEPDGYLHYEILRANPDYEQNKNIGDRTVYRYTNDNDTAFVVYPNGGFYNVHNSPNPLVTYDKQSPNYDSLNRLFDLEKSKRKLDEYGTYFDERELVYRKNK